jgi:type IV pilus assembly protein PilF
MRLLHVIYLTLLFGVSACTVGGDKQSAETNPADIYLQLGVRYLNLNKLEIARENLQRAIDLDPQNAQSHNAIAFLHEKLNKMAEARFHYQKALALMPDDLSTKNNYGRFLCEQGDIDDGMLLLSTITHDVLNERPWLALTNLGRCYMQRANYHDAQAHFTQALHINETYAPALLEMQKVNYLQGHIAEARAFLQRYAQTSEQTAESLLMAVQIEKAAGNTAIALHYQHLLLTKFPLSPEAKKIALP